jgi:radical SAM superfamily enzyme YgiQ (UPF0313 family)
LKKKYTNLLDAEEGARCKIWGEPLTICLVYPNVYRTGMSNLGFQTVYTLFNDSLFIICERAFLPDPEDEQAFASGKPALFSLESQRSLSDFDCIAFSISFENDYPNILKILDFAGIGLLSRDRTKRSPIIFCGGVAVTLNPEPLADFCDFFLLGEAEAIVPYFIPVIHRCLSGGMDREECLYHIQREVPGAYIPKFYIITYGDDQTISAMTPTDSLLPARINKGSAANIQVFLSEQSLFTAGMEFGKMFLTEISRGCNRGCRFCAAGYIYRPARFRTMETLAPSYRKGIERGRAIGLIGTAVSDHPELLTICRSILHDGGAFAIGSLRADRINDDIADILHQTGIESVSIAPEAGSQRLRNVINKGLTEEDILEAAEVLAAHDILNLRLYFLVGLPTETDEDVMEIVNLVKGLQHNIRRRWKGARRFHRIMLSINQFIPKAATPFQWHPLEDIRIVRKRIQEIEVTFRHDSTVRVIHDVAKWNYLQALLSLGDRRVGSILLAAHRLGGNWPRAYREVPINPDFFVYRMKGADEIFPWDFIDHGVSKSLLLKEYERALT